VPDHASGTNRRAEEPVFGNSRVIKRLAPGSPGTRKLLERYGDALVCVRYREDAGQASRYTTVEIVVDRRSIVPAERLLDLPFNDTELRRTVIAAGGQWDPRLRLWRVPTSAIRRLGLLEHVVTHVDDWK
jgi:hypothetical protein